MAIERISKIKSHRIFRGFVWPQDLLDFKEKNLFYGWNGTGKSTLSNLFRSIEKKTPVSEGGLSHMASKNVRVDSLFLDEGFGTLDEEALDTALETLAGLQQDGKLIGVISHVPALKERISTQIQVTLQTGGRSQISGPGCGSVIPV